MEYHNKTTTISLTLVRHGETEANHGGLIQGQKNSSLSENGKYQAKLTGMALNQNIFDKIYASDLERAFDTATIIAANNRAAQTPAYDENQNMVEVNELLRERCFGVFELRPHKEFVTAAENAGFVRGENLYNFVPEGGEGLLDVKKRALVFLQYVIKSVMEKKRLDQHSSSKPDDILIVSHSGFLRQMATYLIKDCNSKLPPPLKYLSEQDLMKYLDRCVKNTAISFFKVQIDIDTNNLVSVECIKSGCTKHLENEG
jgi:broad specificity phosphatase PhoE